MDNVEVVEGYRIENQRKLLSLISAFLNMVYSIKYSSIIETEGGEELNRDIEPVKFTEKREIQLHKVSLSFLVEAYRSGNGDIFLASSHKSLQREHAIALALRCIISKVIGQDYTSLEECALRSH